MRGWRSGSGRLTVRRWVVAGVALLTGLAGMAGVSAGAQAAATTTNAGWTVLFRAPGQVTLSDISCPTRQACVVSATSGGWPHGEIFLTTDGGKVWTEAQTPSLTSRPLFAVGCPRGSLQCEAAGNGEGHNQEATFALIGTGNGTTWRRQANPRNERLNDVVCPAKGVCEAVGLMAAASGPPAMFRTTDGGKVWRNQGRSGMSHDDLVAVSCPSVKVCVAGGLEGMIYTHDGGTKWWWVNKSVQRYLMPSDIACGSTKNCVAVGTEGYAGGRNLLMYSTDGGVRWTRVKVPTAVGGASNYNGGGVNNVACPTATYCVVTGTPATGRGSATIVTTDGGRTWAVQSRPSFGTLGPIACTQKTTCYALVGREVVRRSS